MYRHIFADKHYIGILCHVFFCLFCFQRALSFSLSLSALRFGNLSTSGHALTFSRAETRPLVPKELRPRSPSPRARIVCTVVLARSCSCLPPLAESPPKPLPSAPCASGGVRHVSQHGAEVHLLAQEVRRVPPPRAPAREHTIAASLQTPTPSDLQGTRSLAAAARGVVRAASRVASRQRTRRCPGYSRRRTFTSSMRPSSTFRRRTTSTLG